MCALSVCFGWFVLQFSFDTHPFSHTHVVYDIDMETDIVIIIHLLHFLLRNKNVDVQFIGIVSQMYVIFHTFMKLEHLIHDKKFVFRTD